MKEFKGAILSQNHRPSQGAPSIEMPPMTKILQKLLVSSFSVSFSIFAYNSTRVHQQLKINNRATAINNKYLTIRGPGTPPKVNFFQPL